MTTAPIFGALALTMSLAVLLAGLRARAVLPCAISLVAGAGGLAGLIRADATVGVLALAGAGVAAGLLAVGAFAWRLLSDEG